MCKDVSSELRGWGLHDELVAMYCSNNVGKTLVRLAREGFQCSKGGLLLLLCPNLEHLENSKAYFHGGNYALPAGALGHVNWPGGAEPRHGDPLSLGVDAVPPYALGRFIAKNSPQAMDKTDGTDLSVFYLPDFATFGRLHEAVRNSLQFRRYGRVEARIKSANANVPFREQLPLVKAFLLDKVNGRPDPFEGFTVV
ncbi:unnamed protein product [Aphanomyces euteiches]